MALQYRLSGGANNASPNGSLGGIMSNTQITTDVLENLFDNQQVAIFKKTRFTIDEIIKTIRSLIAKENNPNERK